MRAQTCAQLAVHVKADSMRKSQRFEKLIVRVDVSNGLAGRAGVGEMLIELPRFARIPRLCREA